MVLALLTWRSPEAAALLSALLLFLTYTLFNLLTRRMSTATTKLSSRPSPRPSANQKDSLRALGTWTSSDYKFPTPPPYPNWSITQTKPLPYRPFRHGPKYNTTMGLRNIPPADWIELDQLYPRYHADKARRIASRGAKCVHTSPEALPAAHELLEELRNYLPARYPSLFRRTDIGIDNLWSGESFITTNTTKTCDPMTICARLIQDDLAIMLERPDGEYYFLAGAILLPGFWRLQDKIGMSLAQIHDSGSVPQYREKLHRGMANFFKRVKPGELVARNNYFFQLDDGLAWSSSMGSEDAPDGLAGWNAVEKDRAVEHHYFRSERQTLRRLPKSGGVVFTVRTYLVPVKDIAEEDYVPGRLASAVRSWGEDVSRYKGKELYGKVLTEFLDRKHREQVERGLDLGREDDLRTYPF